MLKGIAASSGITIAKAYKLETPQITIEKKDSNPQEEIEKFKNALAASRKDIETIKERATGKLSDEELEIFDAHLMVVDDPAMSDEVISMIENEKVNAEYALDVVSNNYISMFESLDDEYMRERAADIKDVTTRIKYHILGVDVADLSLIDQEVIVVAHDLTPSDTAQLDKKFTKGFATEIGGRTSHSAIMARSLEIPAVVGIASVMSEVKHGDLLILDALKGQLIVNPDEKTIEQYQEKAEKYISIMKQEVDRSLNIISDFVEYNKIKIKKEQIDLNCLLDDVYDSFKILVNNKKVKLEYKDRDDEEIYFEGDYERLKQVLVNLLKNALEATEENGRIEIYSNIYKKHLEIIIKDNGIGMSKETLEKIKEMFYTTKQNGTGLGVALSNEIIKSHNGELIFESETNKGTTATIRLPFV